MANLKIKSSDFPFLISKDERIFNVLMVFTKNPATQLNNKLNNTHTTTIKSIKSKLNNFKLSSKKSITKKSTL
jgi:hypothetical protein